MSAPSISEAEQNSPRPEDTEAYWKYWDEYWQGRTGDIRDKSAIKENLQWQQQPHPRRPESNPNGPAGQRLSKSEMQGMPMSPEDVQRAYLDSDAGKKLWYRSLLVNEPSAQQLAPGMGPEILYGDPELANVYADPRYISAQEQALAGMQHQALGGLTDAEMRSLNLINSANADAARGQREAALQSLEARGMGGSGQTLSAIMQSNQALGNQRAAQYGQALMNAQQRVPGAINAAADIAGNLRSGAFGEESQRAKTRDIFNTANIDYRRYRQEKEQQDRARAAQQVYENRLQSESLRQGIPRGPTPYQEAAPYAAAGGKLVGDIVTAATS